ncbi:MAG: DinB family protein [Armatimonas sp.]
MGIEVQIVQLIGHAPYHRGQVALLVDQLGGEVVDTDYADWWWYRNHGVE